MVGSLSSVIYSRFGDIRFRRHVNTPCRDAFIIACSSRAPIRELGKSSVKQRPFVDRFNGEPDPDPDE